MLCGSPWVWSLGARSKWVATHWYLGGIYRSCSHCLYQLHRNGFWFLKTGCYQKWTLIPGQGSFATSYASRWDAGRRLVQTNANVRFWAGPGGGMNWESPCCLKSKVAEQKTMLVCLKLEMPKQQWRFKRSIFGIQLRCYWPSRLTPGAASWPGLIKSRFPGWLTGKTNGYTYGQPLNHSTITTLFAICCYNYKVLSEFRRKPS